MRVCCGVLGDEHAAEDAFQATFLVLARRAGSIQDPAQLGPWLRGVARKTARKAMAQDAKRQAREREFPPAMVTVPPSGATSSDLQPVLDEELARLPEGYRRPVVLCYLEGHTTGDAARTLGWPRGTVGTRLARARELLRSRLTRRGVVLSAAAIASAAREANALPVSDALVEATAKAARQFAIGRAATGTVPEAAAVLADDILQGMIMLKWKIALAIALAIGVFATGAGRLMGRTWDPGPNAATAAAAARVDEGTLEGSWILRKATFNGTEDPVGDELKGSRWVIGPRRMKVTLRDKNVSEYAYSIDPAATPKRFDAVQETPANGRQMKGIFQRDGEDLRIAFIDASDERPASFDARPTDPKGVMVVLSLQPVSKAPNDDAEAVAPEDPQAARAKSAKNLRHIALALYNFASANDGTLPAPAITDENGKPLLSWRVAILPLLGAEELYNKFHLDEAWDSPHNKTLLAEMPAVYAPTRAVKTKVPHTTFYQAFVGKGAAFEADGGVKLTAFLDGTDSTILAIEAAEAVPWSKPEDLPFTDDGPLPKIGGALKDGFLVLMADGSVRPYDAKPINAMVLRAAITRAGGEAVNFDQLTSDGTGK